MVLTYNYDTARPGKGELGDFLQVGFISAPEALAGALYFTMHCKKARKQKHSHTTNVNPPHKGRRIPSTTAPYV